MGLLKKFKNVLFEETEVDIPVIGKEEETIIEEEKTDEIVNLNKAEKVKTPIKEEIKEENNTVEMEIDEFKSEPTFEFPVFDESDFSNTIRERTNSRNILEREKHAKKRLDKFDDKEKEEPKTFKPSPIISPVYGVLDENYKKEDIATRNNDAPTVKYRTKNDIDAIRNKAYGTLEDDIEGLIPEDEDDDIMSKTIGDLINEEEIMDEEKPISLDDTDEFMAPKSKKTKAASSRKEKLDKAIEALDEFEEDLERSRSNKERLESDTLETDLFNLIDSMYENKEKGDE